MNSARRNPPALQPSVALWSPFAQIKNDIFFKELKMIFFSKKFCLYEIGALDILATLFPEEA